MIGWIGERVRTQLRKFRVKLSLHHQIPSLLGFKPLYKIIFFFKKMFTELTSYYINAIFYQPRRGGLIEHFYATKLTTD